MRDHILRVTAPAQEEVPDILVVSLPLIVHLGLYWRGGLTPAQLAVEGLTLNIQDKPCNFHQSYPHLGHELSWHQRVPAINPAGVVTVGPGGEQLRGQPLPLDPGNRGPEQQKVCTKPFPHFRPHLMCGLSQMAGLLALAWLCTAPAAATTVLRACWV